MLTANPKWLSADILLGKNWQFTLDFYFGREHLLPPFLLGALRSDNR